MGKPNDTTTKALAAKIYTEAIVRRGIGILDEDSLRQHAQIAIDAAEVFEKQHQLHEEVKEG